MSFIKIKNVKILLALVTLSGFCLLVYLFQKTIYYLFFHSLAMTLLYKCFSKAVRHVFRIMKLMSTCYYLSIHPIKTLVFGTIVLQSKGARMTKFIKSLTFDHKPVTTNVA
jgi:hypothetical protein